MTEANVTEADAIFFIGPACFVLHQKWKHTSNMVRFGQMFPSFNTFLRVLEERGDEYCARGEMKFMKRVLN